ncbi:MAG: sulfurtransferase TusA family protein [Acidobacteriota bacterium]|nr:sulfurtransferase TusA family protein [Acidobacteriota bacterium]
MQHLDTRGLFCPVPILMTARAMRSMQSGERLEVVGDDPGIAEDMPAWCRETGHRLVHLEHQGDIVTSLVEKADEST